MISPIRRARPARFCDSYRLDRPERGGAGDGVAAVGAAEAARVDRVHDLGTPRHRGER